MNEQTIKWPFPISNRKRMNSDFYTFTRDEIYKAFLQWETDARTELWPEGKMPDVREHAETTTKTFLEYAKK